VDININTVPVPKFRELVRVEGTLDEILTAAGFGNWKDKYIEVRVRLEKPEVGMGDRIRNVFDSKGGRVLVVESILSDREDGESISASDIKSRSPADIFKEFYDKKYGKNTAPDELDELLKTFNELAEISNIQEREP
jgi:exonuclease SbcD